MKKYEILKDKDNTIQFEGRTLYRIRALKNFGDVKTGDLGGYVSNKYNLSQDGDCWIYDNAKCMDNSVICNNSRMYDNAIMCDNSMMCDNAMMCGDSRMYHNAKMFSNSMMFDNSEMYDNARMYDNSVLKNNEKLYGRLYSKVDKFIETINPNGRIVTGVLKEGKILFNIGCQEEITKEKFIDRIYNKDGGIEENPHRKEYLKIIKFIEDILNNESSIDKLTLKEILSEENEGKIFKCLANGWVILNDNGTLLFRSKKINNNDYQWKDCVISNIWLNSEYEEIKDNI